MFATPETLRRLEQLHVRAWPALESARVEGWLWRWSGGASQRANSVSTVDFAGQDLDAAIDRVEARYRAKSAPSRFHTFDLSRPDGLAARLFARGYQPRETTVTMLTTAETPMLATAESPMLATAASTRPPADVEIAAEPSAEWLDIYMRTITESRRLTNREILRNIPDPRAFFTVRRDERAISSALCVAHRGHAVAECVATPASARGQRGAESAMRAVLAWAASLGAQTVGLQVVADNAPALALYRRLGFEPVCENRFWAKPLAPTEKPVWRANAS